MNYVANVNTQIHIAQFHLQPNISSVMKTAKYQHKQGFIFKSIYDMTKILFSNSVPCLTRWSFVFVLDLMETFNGLMDRYSPVVWALTLYHIFCLNHYRLHYIAGFYKLQISEVQQIVID